MVKMGSGESSILEVERSMALSRRTLIIYR